MSTSSDPKKIRVLYVDKEPTRLEFTRSIKGKLPNLEITTTSNPHDVVKILRDGFDCLILNGEMGDVDGPQIAETVRGSGFPSLPIIIIRGSDKVTTKKEDEGAGVDAFYDEERGSERVEELAATVLRLAESRPKKAEAKKRGIHAPIGA